MVLILGHQSAKFAKIGTFDKYTAQYLSKIQELQSGDQFKDCLIFRKGDPDLKVGTNQHYPAAKCTSNVLSLHTFLSRQPGCRLFLSLHDDYRLSTSIILNNYCIFPTS